MLHLALLVALAPSAEARTARVAAAEQLVAQADRMDEVPEAIRSDADAVVELALERRDELKELDAAAEDLAPRRGSAAKRSAIGVARGLARLDYAALLRAAPVPADFLEDPDLIAIYHHEIDKLAIPLERQAFNELVGVIDVGARKNRWTEWQTAALVTLTERAPAHHARWTDLQKDRKAFARGCRKGVAAACELANR